MATDPGITLLPVTEVPWADARTVFGTRGDPARCWCQYYKVSNRDWNETERGGLERLLCSQVEDAEVAPGIIAYLDGEPVGWCAVEPRPGYPRVLTSRVVSGGSDEDPEDHTVWAVSCFVVRVGFRRRGVSAALLGAAIEHAIAHGARVIEGYPVDTAVKKASSAELFHGTLSIFEAAGFALVSRPSESRAVMKLVLG